MDSSSDLYSNLKYLNGFGNGFASEALPGAIPVGTNPTTQARIALLSSNTASSPNSSLALPLLSSGLRTRRSGTTNYVHRPWKDNMRGLSTPLKLWPATSRNKIWTTIQTN